LVRGNQEDEFFDDMADYYAKEIFRIVGQELESEIRIEDFKRAIEEGNDSDRKFLCMFCCAEDTKERKHINEEGEGYKSIF